MGQSDSSGFFLFLVYFITMERISPVHESLGVSYMTRYLRYASVMQRRDRMTVVGVRRHGTRVDENSPTFK